jgi:hypothetical protein
MPESSEAHPGVAKAQRLGKWTVALLGVEVLLSGAVVVAGFFRVAQLQQAASGVRITAQEADARAAVYGCALLLYFLAFIAAAIVWLCWQHRAYANLKVLGTGEAETTPGWAVGSWFVPILNLALPYQIVKEMWLRSQAKATRGVDAESSPAIVRLWWGCWIGEGVVAFFHKFAQRGTGIPAMVDDTHWIMIQFALNLFAALLAMTIVRRIGAFQQQASLLDVSGGRAEADASPAPFSWMR